jgi:hypothetical protein
MIPLSNCGTPVALPGHSLSAAARARKQDPYQDGT